MKTPNRRRATGPTVAAVDNFGQPYRGIAGTRILSLAEIAALEKPPTATTASSTPHDPYTEAAERLAGTVLDELGTEVWSRAHARRVIAAAIRAAVEVAVEAEREACAAIADEEADSPDGDAAATAAERIRARGSR